MDKNIDNIVFYDGDCGFCNASVQFILKKRKVDFYFCPLQSDFAEKCLKEHQIEINLETIYYKKKNRLYNRSSAALKICAGLKGGYPLLQFFWIIPKFLRDLVYNAIAKRRHRIKKGYCAIPKEEEKKFFL